MSAATMTGLPLDLTGASLPADFRLWHSKGDAAAALRALRMHGWNVDDGSEIHPAHTRFAWGWVVGRPDHFGGVTYLMTEAGAWIAGRLTDPSPCWCPTPCTGGHAAPWADLGRRLAAPTFTHVTHTVPDAANRRERYKTKSNGSCGRYVRSDDSVALCTCGWKVWEQTRGEAQDAARTHRALTVAPGCIEKVG